ncbi:lysozyme inhibitor LprI family protein [Chelativorans xinjiangense]|uniref:lysozyme inhibitor LprI family protein n=1 Tax=Chelativorans xinjiangense TaxID=2681485 RepID=UPI00135AB6CE|nr:lysozyme inhibitor LprI family protein [Chelativorans xinjiangense]
MTRIAWYSATLTVALALAAGKAASDELYDQCIDRSDGTNTAWGECGSDWVKREDDKLNATWKKVFAQTDGQTRTDLLAEQRLWIAYKEGACKFYANGDWGREGQVLEYAACQAGVIAARTKDLEGYEAFFDSDG